MVTKTAEWNEVKRRMSCASRDDHRCDVYDRNGNYAGGRSSAEWFEMRCNLCGEVVPWKASVRDRIKAIARTVRRVLPHRYGR